MTVMPGIPDRRRRRWPVPAPLVPLLSWQSYTPYTPAGPTPAGTTSCKTCVVTHLGGDHHLARPIGRASVCHQHRRLRLQLPQLLSVDVQEEEVDLGRPAGAVCEAVGDKEQLQVKVGRQET